MKKEEEERLETTFLYNKSAKFKYELVIIY